MLAYCFTSIQQVDNNPILLSLRLDSIVSFRIGFFFHKSGIELQINILFRLFSKSFSDYECCIAGCVFRYLNVDGIHKALTRLILQFSNYHIVLGTLPYLQPEGKNSGFLSNADFCFLSHSVCNSYTLQLLGRRDLPAVQRPGVVPLSY